LERRLKSIIDAGELGEAARVIRSVSIEVTIMAERAAPETADELIAATGQEVSDAAHNQYDRVLASIRREPLKGVAIAAGVGFVLALILR
jgi:ElaB/YqjD/DUF883 family membrane-anchored ribosome-binding protein